MKPETKNSIVVYICLFIIAMYLWIISDGIIRNASEASYKRGYEKGLSECRYAVEKK